MINVVRLQGAVKFLQELSENWEDDLEEHYPEGLPDFQELVAQFESWSLVYSDYRNKKILNSILTGSMDNIMKGEKDCE